MKYKHALALNPYFRDSTATMGIFPPTGLEYIATNMKAHVGKVTLLDLRYDRKFQQLETLSDFIRGEIDLLCISINWSTQFNAICRFIGKLPRDVTTVVGGHKATEEVEVLFERCPNIDLIVRGEGEDTIREIVQGVPNQDILGLSFRQGEKIVNNECRPFPDIDHVPFPDRSLRRHDYHWIQNGIRMANQTFDTVLTSRGCPYHCKFCTFNLNPLGQKREYTERSLESVVEELKAVTAEVVMFSDDNFFTNPKRSEKLCDLIIANGIKKKFVIQTRIEIARHEALLKKAAKAGFKVFLVGIESPHDKILKLFNKGFNRQKIRDAFKVLNKYDFYIHGYFIYGNIGETEEEMIYIARFARELRLDSITFQKLRIEKFSPLQEIAEKTPGYYYNSVGGPLYSEQYGLEDLKRIRNKIRSRFYSLGQVLRILRKVNRIGLFPRGDLLRLPLKVPRIMFRLLLRKIGKRGRPPHAARRRVASRHDRPGSSSKHPAP